MVNQRDSAFAPVDPGVGAATSQPPYSGSTRRSSRLYPRLSHLFTEEQRNENTQPSGDDGGEEGDFDNEELVKSFWRELVQDCRKGEREKKLAEVITFVQDTINVQGDVIREQETEKNALKREIDQLQQDLQNLGQEKQEAGKKLRQLEEELATEKAKVRDCQKIIGELTMQARESERTRSQSPEVTFPRLRDESVPLTVGSGLHRSEKLPDPEIFKDGSHQEYRSWERQMRDKLDINADRIGGERQKLAYASSRIGGNAASFMEPWLDRNNRNRVTDVDDFFEKMRKRFGDPFSRETARAAFRKLYQGKKEFQEFLGEFYRLSVEGEYSEEEQLEELREKISIELKQAVIGFRPSSSAPSFREFVEHLQWVDREQKSIKQSSARFHNLRNKTLQGGSATLSPSSSAHAPTGDLKLETEKRTSMWNPKCYACGQMGHISKDCPQGKGTPPAKS